MGQFSLSEFSKKDDGFSNKSFETDFIRQIDVNCDMEFFSYKQSLETKVIPKPKQKKTMYGVIITTINNDVPLQEVQEFKSPDSALDFFYGLKEQLEWLQKKDK